MRKRGLLLKRTFDFTAAAALVVLSPILLGTALATRWFLGSPVLFRQTRLGLHGRPFSLLKFRTMIDAHVMTPIDSPLPDSERLSPTGRLMRRLSIDELPQLLNVLRGDMNLNGPRPHSPPGAPMRRCSSRAHSRCSGDSGVAVITARVLGPEDRGRYYYVLTLAAVGAQLASLGIHSNNSFLVSRRPELLPQLMANAAWIALVGGTAAAQGWLPSTSPPGRQRNGMCWRP